MGFQIVDPPRTSVFLKSLLQRPASLFQVLYKSEQSRKMPPISLHVLVDPLCFSTFPDFAGNEISRVTWLVPNATVYATNQVVVAFQLAMLINVSEWFVKFYKPKKKRRNNRKSGK
jgi:hypothetical protein